MRWNSPACRAPPERDKLLLAVPFDFLEPFAERDGLEGPASMVTRGAWRRLVRVDDC